MQHALIILLLTLVIVLTLLVSRRHRQAARPNPIFPATPQPDPLPTPAEALADLLAFARLRVAAGFDSRAAISDAAHEMAEDEYPSLDLGAHIPAIVDQALSEHAAEEASWTTVTDCDRLDTAFRLMEERGVVARQNFACCQTCGHAEIGDEISKTQALRKVVGYTFYHMQDTDRAAEGGGLYLAYGSLADTKEHALAVGNTVVACLREAGLQPIWDNDAAKRIYVPLDWKRRRLARSA
ncbi:MAG: hypothetical protein AB2L07_01255 [Thermoanaerobaculaceae bacterium]